MLKEKTESIKKLKFFSSGKHVNLYSCVLVGEYGDLSIIKQAENNERLWC